MKTLKIDLERLAEQYGLDLLLSADFEEYERSDGVVALRLVLTGDKK